MADVAPFRAIRYARPTATVTAPPYDVLTSELRDAYRESDPHNVVHLTLNDSEDEAGRLFRTWLDEGVLVRDDEPAVWALSQDYVGPDGIARRARRASWPRCASSPTKPAPFFPTSARTPGRRRVGFGFSVRRARSSSRSSFSTTASRPSRVPDHEPDLVTDDTRLWRVPGDGIAERSPTGSS